MRLAELQSLFSQAVFDEGGQSPASESLKSQVVSGERLSATKQIEIYRESTLAGLQNALSEIYPVCMRLVGEKFFYALTGRYVRDFPSLSPDLGDYGKEFSEYTADFEPLAGLPYFPDVARLEWRWHRVFHAPPSKSFDYQALAEVSAARQGDIVFSLPRASALMLSAYPVHRIWQANQPEFEGESLVNLEEGGARLLIWRDVNDMRIEPVDDASWHVLNQIRKGRSMASMCERIARTSPTVDVSRILPELVERGWIASFSIADSDSAS